MTETVNISTGELVTVDPSSEIAVTSYLQQARDFLVTAVETTGPEQIARAKAEIATAAEATKQLGLSREIRDDAVELVRRFEYTLAKSIRLGQAAGEIRRAGQRGPQPAYTRVVDGREVEHAASGVTGNCIASPKDFASIHELSGDTKQPGIYALADGVTDEQFDSAIAEAKAEGNLSRANVVRKVKGYVSGDLATRDQRADAIRDLAEQGWTSGQMVDRIGVSEPTVRQIARDYGIYIPADRAMHKQRRVNSNDIVDNLVIGLEGSAMSLDLVDPTDLDRDQAAYWATSLTESLQKLNRFAKQIKEIAQ